MCCNSNVVAAGACFVPNHRKWNIFNGRNCSGQHYTDSHYWPTIIVGAQFVPARCDPLP